LAEVAELTLGNSVIYDRFAGTAILKTDDASAMGCLGYVARASGIRTDARLEHPTVALPVTEIGQSAGDVLARYTVRRDEFAASAALAGAGSASSKAGAAPSCTASRSTQNPYHPRQDRRPVLVQLARAAGRDGRHDRPRLPAD